MRPGKRQRTRIRKRRRLSVSAFVPGCGSLTREPLGRKHWARYGRWRALECVREHHASRAERHAVGTVSRKPAPAEDGLATSRPEAQPLFRASD